MVSHKCSECGYYTKRKFDLKRHLKNVHGGRVNNTSVPTKSSVVTSQPEDGLHRRRRKHEPEDGLYTEEEFEETMDTLHARFPSMNFDTLDPRFMHPFTAIIAGPSSSESQCFVCD